MGDDGVVIVPPAGPEIFVHVPVPVIGVLPAMVTDVVVEQMVWSGPAFDVVGVPLRVMFTWSVEAVHGLLVIVHWNV